MELQLAPHTGGSEPNHSKWAVVDGSKEGDAALVRSHQQAPRPAKAATAKVTHDVISGPPLFERENRYALATVLHRCMQLPKLDSRRLV